MRSFSFICLLLTGIFILTGCSKKIPSSKTYMKNGVLVEYYTDEPINGLVDEGAGTIKCYKNGILDGESTFALTEEKKAVLNYKAGFLTGNARYYYKGELTFECNFRDGLLDGNATDYKFDGKIKIFEGTFRQGKAVGNILLHDNSGNMIAQFDIDPNQELTKVKYYSPSKNLGLENYGLSDLNGWVELYFLNDPVISPIKIMMNDSKYNYSDIYKNSSAMLLRSGTETSLYAFITVDYSVFNHSVSIIPGSFLLDDYNKPLSYAFISQSDAEINRIKSDIKKLFSDSSYTITAGPKISQSQYESEYFECPVIITETLWENKNKDMFIVRENKYDTDNDLYMGTTFEIFHVGFLK